MPYPLSSVARLTVSSVPRSAKGVRSTVYTAEHDKHGQPLSSRAFGLYWLPAQPSSRHEVVYGLHVASLYPLDTACWRCLRPRRPRFRPDESVVTPG